MANHKTTMALFGALLSLPIREQTCEPAPTTAYCVPVHPHPDDEPARHEHEVGSHRAPEPIQMAPEPMPEFPPMQQADAFEAYDFEPEDRFWVLEQAAARRAANFLLLAAEGIESFRDQYARAREAGTVELSA